MKIYISLKFKLNYERKKNNFKIKKKIKYNKRIINAKYKKKRNNHLLVFAKKSN